MPKVSVVIPAYNCEKFISTAIESVLTQTYKDYEIIVVNDGSMDRTDEILSKYASKIKKIYQPNQGPAGARNTGIANSEGEYIAFLDQDDAWLPNKLEMQVEVMKKNTRLGLVYTDTYILAANSFDKIESNGLRGFKLRRPHRGKVLKELFMQNFVCTSSVIVRRECFDRFGFFKSALFPIEDYDLWLRFSTYFEFDYIDKPLVKFRDHPASFRKNEILTITHIIDTLNGLSGDYPEIRNGLGPKFERRISEFYTLLGKKYIFKGDFKNGVHNFLLSVKTTKSIFTVFYIILSTLTDSLTIGAGFLKYSLCKTAEQE